MLVPTESLLAVVLKGPLLLSLAISTYQGMTPPMGPPHPDEKKRATEPDLLEKMLNAHRPAVATAKMIFCGLALAEVATLMAQALPADLFLRRTLSFITPVIRLQFDSGASLRITYMSALGCVLGTLGGIIRVWCHRTLGRFFTWEVAVRDGHKLITTGPYSVVRHPSYTGWYLVVAGNLMLMWSSGSFFIESGVRQTAVGLSAICYLVVCVGWVCAGMLYRTATEDVMLRKEFGAQWEDWARRTRYRLVPFFY